MSNITKLIQLSTLFLVIFSQFFNSEAIAEGDRGIVKTAPHYEAVSQPTLTDELLNIQNTTVEAHTYCPATINYDRVKASLKSRKFAEDGYGNNSPYSAMVHATLSGCIGAITANATAIKETNGTDRISQKVIELPCSLYQTSIEVLCSAQMHIDQKTSIMLHSEDVHMCNLLNHAYFNNKSLAISAYLKPDSFDRSGNYLTHKSHSACLSHISHVRQPGE